MIDIYNKIELCSEVFSKEEVWEAYCNVCEANTCFLFPYEDIEDLAQGISKDEEEILYEYLLNH